LPNSSLTEFSVALRGKPRILRVSILYLLDGLAMPGHRQPFVKTTQ
jgi:hypothetical protein